MRIFVLLFQALLAPHKFERKSFEAALANEISQPHIEGDLSDHVLSQIRSVSGSQAAAVQRILRNAVGAGIAVMLLGWLTGLLCRALFGNMSHLVAAILQTISGAVLLSASFCQITGEVATIDGTTLAEKFLESIPRVLGAVSAYSLFVFLAWDLRVDSSIPDVFV